MHRILALRLCANLSISLIHGMLEYTLWYESVLKHLAETLIMHLQACQGEIPVLPPVEMSVCTMCHRVGEWIVHSLVPKGFSHFSQEAWGQLPTELSWMRTLYAEQYIEKQLGLQPSVTVEVQGMGSKPFF